MGLGVFIGGGSAAAIRILQNDRTAEVASENDFIGRSAAVVVPFKRGGVGKVRVEVKGQLVDLLATTDEEIISAKDEVIVVEMEGTRAKIARMDS